MRRKKELGQRFFRVALAMMLAMGLAPAGAVSAFADEVAVDDRALGDCPPGALASENAGSRVIFKSDDVAATEMVENTGGEVVGKVGDAYVAEYADEQQAEQAASSLDELCEFAEVDQEVMAAGETTAPAGPLVSGGMSAGLAKVALVDSGAPESPAVVKELAMIGDSPADESGHATEMLDTMLEYASGMEVVSVRVLDGANRGSVATLYAGIMAAIDEGVDLINLSLVTKATESSQALVQAVSKAVESGITVVTAAGNGGADAADYLPAGAPGAITAGSCDEEGARMPTSNYGDCVDVYAVSPSTSYAAAMTTGWLAANRLSDGTFPDVQTMVENDTRFRTDVADPADVRGDDIGEDGVQAATDITTVTSTELRHEDTNGALVNRMNSAVPGYDISFDNLGSCLDITAASIVGSSALARSGGSYLHTDTIMLNGNAIQRNGLWLNVPNKPSSGNTLEVTGANGGNIATLTFPNVAQHKNGTRLDFTVVIKAATLRYPASWNSATGKPQKMLICSTPSKTFTLHCIPVAVNVDGEYKFAGQMGGRLNIECYFTPQGTGADGAKQTGAKLFSAYDLDVADYWATPGFYNQNTDAVWCESVRLVHGFEGTVYAQRDNCILDFSKKAQGWIRSTGTSPLGNSQWPTGFVARKSAASTYMSFTWVGRNCGTKFFEEFEPIKILDRNDNTRANVTDRGIITKNVTDQGTPLASMGQARTNTANRTTKLPWCGTAAYSYTAQPGFKVTNVSVKGLSNNATTYLTNATTAAQGSTFTDTGASGTHMTKQDYQIIVTTAAVPDVTAAIVESKLLEGANLSADQFTFGLYSNAACTTPVRIDSNGYEVASGGAAVTAKNKADGTVSFPTIKYKFSGDPKSYPKSHTYYAKEIAGTDSQVTYDSSVKTVTVTETYSEANGYRASVSGNNQQFKNTYESKTAGVKVTKVSSASGNPKVSGVTFGVYKTSANDYDAIKQGTPVQVMVTGDDGVAQLAGTTFEADGSEYRVIETAVPSGYSLNTTWVGKFTASKTEADKKVYDVGTVTNTPLGGVKVKKVNKDTGDPLSGTEFSVYVASGLGASPSYDDVRKRGVLVDTMTTGVDGVAVLDGKLAADGKTFFVIETNPPAGYDLNTTWVKSFTLTAAGQVVDLTQSGDWCEDKRIQLPLTGGAGVVPAMMGACAAVAAGLALRRKPQTR